MSPEIREPGPYGDRRVKRLVRQRVVKVLEATKGSAAGRREDPVSGATCHPLCASGWDTCDGNAANGCETQLDSVTNCGACGVSCARANASTTCSTGACRIAACNFGWANCDGNDDNGCERSLSGYANSPPGVDLGSFPADTVTSAGLSCPATRCGVVASRTGTQNEYFHVRATDQVSGLCVSQLAVKVELVSPADADYDLYVTGGDNCAGGCSSTLGTGQTDAVTVVRSDSIFSDDSFDVDIEVRFFGGTACAPWTLIVSTGGC